MESLLFDLLFMKLTKNLKMGKKDDLKFLNIDSSLYKTRISKKFENRKPYKPVNPKIIISFISGTIFEIHVREGQNVEKGEVLMFLDAMKMQNKLKSEIKAKVKKIFVKKLDKVSKGITLLSWNDRLYCYLFHTTIKLIELGLIIRWNLKCTRIYNFTFDFIRYVRLISENAINR